MTLRARVGAFFLAGGEPPPAAGDGPTAFAPPAVAPDAGVAAAPRLAAVLGPAGAVVPVAAACAGELRARLRTPAALVCVWRPAGPPAPPPAPPPAGASTPGARRVAQCLADRGAAATACGRLAWLALDEDPAAAAATARGAIAAAGVPAVVALAGPRPAAFEAVLAAADLAVVVLPPDADPAVGTLALAGLPAAARATHPPLAAGPARWAALAGLARLRALPEVGGR